MPHPHPGLQQATRVASDIYPPVFDWLFTHNVFMRWRDVRVPWQLHCIGHPGAGKTTLTALVHRHLAEHAQTQHFPIVPIYIDKAVLDHETYFIEDFLAALYLELGKPTPLEHDLSDQVYDDYHMGRDSREPPRIRDRLRLLRKAIHLRLHALQNARAFLLVDGIDRCSQTIRMMLDEELAKFLDAGLSTLITSRLPDLDQEEVGCDHPYHNLQPDDGSPPLCYEVTSDMFLECSDCGFLLCFTCRGQNRRCCNGHDDSHLVEPYDHVNINIRIPEPSMRDFIAWNLEVEHGELGLGSSARKPPLSDLGKSLMSNTASKSAQVHADNVNDSAEGHIGLAKARLDFIHSMTSLEGVETRRDRLPTSIVTMFDSGLRSLENQPDGQGKIAMRAIAVASFRIYGEGIPNVREILRIMDAGETRSGEDILEATRGFLLASRDEPRNVAVFHSSFFYYIAQRYNQAIHRASADIITRQARRDRQDILEPLTEFSLNELVQSPPLQAIEEDPFRHSIIRKGTLAWQ